MEWMVILFALLGPIGALYWLKPSPARRNLERTRLLAQQKGFKVRLMREEELRKRFQLVPERPVVEYTWRMRAADAATANLHQKEAETVLISYSRLADSRHSDQPPSVLSQFEVEPAVLAFTLTPSRAVLVWTEQAGREKAEPFLDELISMVKEAASARL